MDYNSILTFPNLPIEQVIAKMLRPTSQVQHQKELMSNTPALRPTYSAWIWGTFNYHKALFGPVNEVCTAIRELCEIMEQDVTERERAQMLPMKFTGKKDDPGVLDVLVENFNPFKAQLVKGIGFAVLKECKSVEDLIVCFQAANKKMADVGILQEQTQSTFTTLPPSAEQYEAIRDKDQQRRFREGKGDKRSSADINRLSAEEQREEIDLREFENDQILFDATGREQLSGDFDVMAQHLYNDSQPQVLAFQSPSPRTPGQLVSTKLPFTHGPKLCWKFYGSGVCAAGDSCPFSHNKADHIAFAKRRAEELAGSPWRPSATAIESKLVAATVPLKSQDVRQQAAGGPHAKIHAMEDEDEAGHLSGLVFRS